MHKRQFLKTCTGFVVSGVLSRLLPQERESSTRKNWAGNYRYTAARLDAPTTVAELQKLVRNSNQVKALGSRHSFNGIADTAGDQISVARFNQMTLDEKSRTVKVGAGVKYGQLAPYLNSKGYALHNLASLPHITVAGACATATHGSGNENGNLSTAVSAVEFISGDGELVTLSRDVDGERFQGAVVGLGGLGIITNLTLDVQPTYQVRQVVYLNMSMDHLQHNLDEIFASGYSVSLFTDWQNHKITEVWIKSRIAGTSSEFKDDFFGAKRATRNVHPVIAQSAEKCTEQMGVPGPWYERLPHFRMNFTPSTGDELQSEYIVPGDKAYDAILAVEKLRDRITPHLFITELRTIEADNLWMSTCYKRASMGIHFTWKPEWPVVKNILPMIEESLAPFEARPHWAKLFTMAPSRLKNLYNKLPDYRQMVKMYDPNGKFRNTYLNTYVY